MNKDENTISTPSIDIARLNGQLNPASSYNIYKLNQANRQSQPDLSKFIEYLPEKGYSNLYAYSQREHDSMMENLSQIYADTDIDIEDRADRVQLSKLLSMEYPQYSEGFFYDNLDSFMKQATGYDYTPKSYLDHLKSTFKASALSYLSSIEFFTTMMVDPQNKDNMMEKLRGWASEYRRDIGDDVYKGIFRNMLSAAVTQAPNMMATIPLSLGGAAIGGLIGGAASSKAGAFVARHAGDAMNWVFSAAMEGGSVMLDLANAGADDDTIRAAGLTVGAINGTLEVVGDNMILKPFRVALNKNPSLRMAYTDLLDYTWKGQGRNLAVQMLKSIGTEVPTEIAQEMSSMLAYNFAVEWEQKHGRLPGVEKYTAQQFADAVGEIALETLKSTTVMAFSSAFLSASGSYIGGNWRHSIQASDVMDGTKDSILLRSSDIKGRQDASQWLSKKDLKNSKATPIHVVRIGDQYFIKGQADNAQLSAVKSSKYVYAIVDNFGIGDIDVESLPVEEIGISLGNAYYSLQEALAKNLLDGYDLLDNGKKITTNLEDAKYIAVKPSNAGGNVVVVELGTKGNANAVFEQAVFGQAFTNTSTNKTATTKPTRNVNKAASDFTKRAKEKTDFMQAEETTATTEKQSTAEQPATEQTTNIEQAVENKEQVISEEGTSQQAPEDTQQTQTESSEQANMEQPIESEQQEKTKTEGIKPTKEEAQAIATVKEDVVQSEVIKAVGKKKAKKVMAVRDAIVANSDGTEKAKENADKKAAEIAATAKLTGDSIEETVKNKAENIDDLAEQASKNANESDDAEEAFGSITKSNSKKNKDIKEKIKSAYKTTKLDKATKDKFLDDFRKWQENGKTDTGLDGVFKGVQEIIDAKNNVSNAIENVAEEQAKAEDGITADTIENAIEKAKATESPAESILGWVHKSVDKLESKIDKALDDAFKDLMESLPSLSDRQKEEIDALDERKQAIDKKSKRAKTLIENRIKLYKEDFAEENENKAKLSKLGHENDIGKDFASIVAISGEKQALIDDINRLIASSKIDMEKAEIDIHDNAIAEVQKAVDNSKSKEEESYHKENLDALKKEREELLAEAESNKNEPKLRDEKQTETKIEQAIIEQANATEETTKQPTGTEEEESTTIEPPATETAAENTETKSEADTPKTIQELATAMRNAKTKEEKDAIGRKIVDLAMQVKKDRRENIAISVTPNAIERLKKIFPGYDKATRTNPFYAALDKLKVSKALNTLGGLFASDKMKGAKAIDVMRSFYNVASRKIIENIAIINNEKATDIEVENATMALVNWVTAVNQTYQLWDYITDDRVPLDSRINRITMAGTKVAIEEMEGFTNILKKNGIDTDNDAIIDMLLYADEHVDSVMKKAIEGNTDVKFQDGSNNNESSSTKYTPFYEDYVYRNKNGQFTFDKDKLANAIHNKSNGNISIREAKMAASIMSLLPKNAVDKIIRQNDGRLLLNTTETTIDIGDANGAFLWDTAQIILSPKSNLSTILHESFHAITWADDGIRRDIYKSVRNALNNVHDRGQLVSFMLENSNVFKDGNALQAYNDLQLMFSNNLTQEQTNAIDEAITSLYEAWYMSGRTSLEASHPKLAQLFRKVADIFNRIYREVTGKEFLPEGIERQFAALLDGTYDVSFDDSGMMVLSNKGFGNLTAENGKTIRELVDENGGFAQFQTVYHGSQHTFYVFDSSKIGSGEGAQSFGWGLYVTDDPEIAMYYAKKLGDKVETTGKTSIPIDIETYHRLISTISENGIDEDYETGIFNRKTREIYDIDDSIEFLRINGDLDIEQKVNEFIDDVIEKDLNSKFFDEIAIRFGLGETPFSYSEKDFYIDLKYRGSDSGYGERLAAISYSLGDNGREIEDIDVTDKEQVKKAKETIIKYLNSIIEDNRHRIMELSSKDFFYADKSLFSDNALWYFFRKRPRRIITYTDFDGIKESILERKTFFIGEDGDYYFTDLLDRRDEDKRYYERISIKDKPDSSISDEEYAFQQLIITASKEYGIYDSVLKVALKNELDWYADYAKRTQERIQDLRNENEQTEIIMKFRDSLLNNNEILSSISEFVYESAKNNNGDSEVEKAFGDNIYIGFSSVDSDAISILIFIGEQEESEGETHAIIDEELAYGIIQTVSITENIINNNIKNILENSQEHDKNAIDKNNEEIKALNKGLIAERMAVDNNLGKQPIKHQHNLYTVGIPDDGYLAWNEHNTKENVELVLSNLIKDGYIEESQREDLEELFLAGKVIDYTDENIDPTVRDLMSYGCGLYHYLQDSIFNSDKKASLYLLKLGFNGISYPTGMIGGFADNGHRNYVIFDDKMMTITDHIQFQQDNALSQIVKENSNNIVDAVRQSGIAKVIIAYNGARSEFFAFSTDYIGEGEGNLTFGWGIYLTDNPEIAKFYAEKFYKKDPRRQVTIQQVLIEKNALISDRKARLKGFEANKSRLDRFAGYFKDNSKEITSGVMQVLENNNALQQLLENKKMVEEHNASVPDGGRKWTPYVEIRDDSLMEHGIIGMSLSENNAGRKELVIVLENGRDGYPVELYAGFESWEYLNDTARLEKAIVDGIKTGKEYADNHIKRENSIIRGSEETIARVKKEAMERGVKEKDLETSQEMVSIGFDRHIYTVEIPADGYLVWDAPIPEDSLDRVMNSLQQDGLITENEYQEWHERFTTDKNSGEELYRYLWTNVFGSAKEASLYLYRQGFYGLDYKAGTKSGGQYANSTSRNFVMFNDDDIKITNHVSYQQANNTVKSMQDSISDPSTRQQALEVASNIIFSRLGDSIGKIDLSKYDGSNVGEVASQISNAIYNSESYKKYIRAFDSSTELLIRANIEKKINAILISPTATAQRIDKLAKRLDSNIRNNKSEETINKNANVLLHEISTLWDNAREKSSNPSELFNNYIRPLLKDGKQVAGIDATTLYDKLVAGMRKGGTIDGVFTPQEVLAMGYAIVDDNGYPVLAKTVSKGGSYQSALATMIGIAQYTPVGNENARTSSRSYTSVVPKSTLDTWNLLVDMFQNPEKTETETLPSSIQDMVRSLENLGLESDWIKYIMNGDADYTIAQSIAKGIDSRLKELKAEIEEANQNPMSKEKIASLEKEVNSLEKKIEKLNADSQTKDENNQSLKKELKQAQRELKKLGDENTSLKAENQSIGEESGWQSMKDTIAYMQKQIKGYKSIISQYKKGFSPQIRLLNEQIKALEKAKGISLKNLDEHTKAMNKIESAATTSSRNVHDADIMDKARSLYESFKKKSRVYSPKKGIQDSVIFDIGKYAGDDAFINILNYLDDHDIITLAKDIEGNDAWVISKSLSMLDDATIQGLAEQFENLKAEAKERLTERNKDKQESFQRKLDVITRSLNGFKKLGLSDADIDRIINDYKNNARPGSETFKNSSKQGLINKFKTQLTETSKMVKKLSPALYAYMYGGELDGKYNDNNYNSAYDKQFTKVQERTRNFNNKLMDIFGVDEKNLKYKMKSLFKKHYVEVDYSDPNVLIGETYASTRPELYALGERFESIQRSIESAKNRLAQLEVDLLKTIGEEEIEDIAREKERLEMSIAKDEDALSNRKTSNSTYTMQELMGIYIHAQSADGLDRLLGRGSYDNYMSNNLSFGEIMWVMDKFLNDSSYSQYKEIADYIMEDVGARYDDMHDVVLRAENRVMKRESMYFPMTDNIFSGEKTMTIEGISLFEFLDMGFVDNKNTKDRTGSRHAINLDVIDQYISAITRQEHYIAFKELTDEMTKMFSDDGQLSNALRTAYSNEPGKAQQAIDQIREYNALIKGKTGQAEPLSDMFSKVRSNFVVAKLWGNLSTVLQQFPTYMLAARDVGWLESTKYLAEFLRDRKRNTDMIYNLSPQMRERARLDIDTYRSLRSQDVSGLQRKLESWAKADLDGVFSGIDKFIDMGLSIMESADRAVANAMWYAIFNHNLDSYLSNPIYATQEEAMRACATETTQKVLDLSPTNNAKDNALIYSSNSLWWRNLLLFTAQLNKQFNMLYGDIMDFNPKSFESWKPLLEDLLVLGVVSASVALITGTPYPDEDDDDKWQAFFGEWLTATIAEMAAGIPIAGDTIKDTMNGTEFADSNWVTYILNLNKSLMSENRDNSEIASAIGKLILKSTDIIGAPTTAIQKGYKTIMNVIDDPSIGDAGYLLNTRTGNFWTSLTED